MPVTSRPLSTTRPRSGRRWPVIRLKSVVLPAPFGPMMAPMLPPGTSKLTPATARKRSKICARSPPSSTPEPREQAPRQRPRGTGDPAGKAEQQDDQDSAEHERPVLGVRDDLLVQEDQHQGPDARPVEAPHAAEERHDEHFGRLRPVCEVGEDAPVEDAEESAGEPREGSGQHEGSELVPADVDADELGALGVLPDRRQDAAEGRPHDPVQGEQARRHQHQRHEVVVLRSPPPAEQRYPRAPPLDPAEIRIGDLRHALLAPGDLVPLEADRPHDLREGQRQHREIDAFEPHAEKTEDEGARPGQRTRGGPRQQERRAELLHEDTGRVGAHPEVGGVAEGHEAGVAHQQVEARGEERPDDPGAGDEPRPPITTTTNASTMTSVSMPGTVARMGLMSAPPSPPRNEASMNTHV